MKKLRQLKPQDVWFLGGETPSVYQHTAGLSLLDASDRPGFGFEDFRKYVESRIALIPHFQWKLHEVPLGLDLPYWVADENFSFDNHIRRIAVPAPGDHKALAEVAAYLYCKHLDRRRPLWETWFIEGLADGKFAVLQKMHHCLMDGEGASKLSEILSDFEPHADLPVIDPNIANARPGEVPEQWRQFLTATVRLSSLPARLGREAFTAIRQRVSRQWSPDRKPDTKPVTPGIRFNDDISGDRGLVFGSLPLQAIKDIKSHFNTTVNDVVLALMSSSLRDYLMAGGELPDQSLRTSIVVSVRTGDDDVFSNKVSSVAVTLATDLPDPARRLQAIAKDTARAKSEVRQGGRGIMEIMSHLPPVLVNAIVNLSRGDQMTQVAGVNLVISNVRGSDRPMYIDGARVSATYPMSIISPGGGLNVTCVSYAGNLDFGITVEPRLVPEPWLLIGGLEKALAEYMALTERSVRDPNTPRGAVGSTVKKRSGNRIKNTADPKKGAAPGRKNAGQRSSAGMKQ